MSKISFESKGKEYTLEYTRNTVRQMEKNGFVIGNIFDAPMSLLPDLFAGAFLAHHPYIKRNVVDEIFDEFENKKNLISTLVKMYNEPIEALLTDDEGEAKGNKIAWVTTN